MRILGRKWTKKIMLLLAKGEYSFSQIQQQLGISSKVLAETLNLLQHNRLVKRVVNEDRSTTYYLTDKGEKVVKVIKTVEKLNKESESK